MEKTIFVQDMVGGSQADHRVNVRIYTELAWHSLIAKTPFVRPSPAELEGVVTDYTSVARSYGQGGARDGAYAARATGCVGRVG